MELEGREMKKKRGEGALRCTQRRSFYYSLFLSEYKELNRKGRKKRGTRRPNGVSNGSYGTIQEKR